MPPGTRARDWAEVDFYAVLGVERDATDDDIARAYRTLAKQLHPDSGATAEQVTRFVDVTTAYDVLADPDLRRDYDRVRLVERVTVEAGPMPAFKPAKVRRVEFTRKRAWFALAAGIGLLVVSIVVGWATWSLHERDAQDRADTVAISAFRTEVDGAPYVAFDVGSDHYVVPEPERKEKGGIGGVVDIRYDPDDPTQVIADESRAPRDITLAIVALKLFVGGAVFTFLGTRRLTVRR
ncbi:MAG: DnaJ domain-containing protein [Actinomycetota bacterium]|nr:DnaJ domain-containing protein [Actinomycetota bacterium]